MAKARFCALKIKKTVKKQLIMKSIFGKNAPSSIFLVILLR
ncbi:hypothetical protein EVA_03691 [gut metagenome]|uniref:Uncharacterized protein n=1 Tax=gut metagenome TaxID=749906 RepID=J9D650_9ZZZZ